MTIPETTTTNSLDYYVNMTPAENRVFTTKEIVKAFELNTTGSITHICRKLDITPVTKNTRAGKTNFYSVSDYLKIKAYVMAQKKLGAHKVLDVSTLHLNEPTDINELFRLHPLVKDPNFFKLSFFPDTKPFCFEELDDE